MGKNVVKAASLLLIINVCVKLLGFGREMVIANAFGASSASDAYLVGNTIPYFLQAILGYAFVSAILPMLAGCGENQQEADRLGSTLINLVAIAMLIISILGIVAAPALVFLTAPNLAANTAALATELTRIIFPSVLFMSVGMVASGILNSGYRFAAAALAPGVASLAIILAASLPNQANIYLVAVGTLVGYVGFLLIQLLDLPRAGFHYHFVCDLRHPAIRRVLKDIIPIVLGLSVNQIYIILNRYFASGLSEGSISALNYANKLMNLPVGLFVAAIITAVFPKLAELAKEADRQALGATVQRGLAMILTIAIPAAVGLMLLDTPIVQLLFQRGSFDAEDTRITAQALLAMSPGLIFFGISMLMMRVSYALDDVYTPLITGAISIAVNVLFSLLTVGQLQHSGLAWADTIAAAVNALLMIFLLDRKFQLGICRSAYLRRSLVLTLLGSMAMILLLLVLNRLLPAADGLLALLLTVVIRIGGAVILYLLLLILCKADVLLDICRGWRDKI